MGLTMTLTDEEIPVSPVFVEFLYHSITQDGEFFVGEWYAQEKEELVENKDRFEGINSKVAAILAEQKGKEAVIRSYRYFKEMLTGNPNALNHIAKYHFFFVIGIPRTGGTYITKQLFRACKVDYTTVQNALAHDGFPHLAPLEFRGEKGGNIHTNGLLQLAEYLTMVDLYFSKHGKLAHKGGIMVPKKFTKGVYNFPLIRTVFGDNASFIITIRDPLGMIQSIADKSGGIPENGKFTVRSMIEKWALSDWMERGFEESAIKDMPYVDVLLGYWHRYHCQIAMQSIPNMPRTSIVTFGVKEMTEFMKNLFDDLGVDLKPEKFKKPGKHKFSATETKKANKIVKDVEGFWKSLGMKFPTAGLLI